MGSRQRCRVAVAVVLLAPVLWAAAAGADAHREVEALEARVSALEALRPAAAQSSAVVEGSVAAVLADAGGRAAGAGRDEEGFFVRAGGFSVRPEVLFIFGHVSGYAEDAKNGRSPDTQSGLEVRTLLLTLRGRAFDETVEYHLAWRMENTDAGRPALRDAALTWRVGEKVALKLGQFDDRVYLEETVDDGRQLLADRSVMNELLAGGRYDRVQGMAGVFGDAASAFHGQVTLHDGGGSLNTTFADGAAGTGFAVRESFGASGRVEWKAQGRWKDYADLSARETTDDFLAIGVGTSWTQGVFADGVAGAGTGGNRFLFAADALWKLSEPRVAVFAAYVADYTNFRDGAAGDHRWNWGALLQAGWMITNQWEAFARYDYVGLDRDFVRAGVRPQVHEVTVGATYYLGKDGNAGHRAKVTLDAGYLPHGSPAALPRLGVHTAGAGEQIYVRGQVQLAL